MSTVKKHGNSRGGKLMRPSGFSGNLAARQNPPNSALLSPAIPFYEAIGSKALALFAAGFAGYSRTISALDIGATMRATRPLSR